MSSPIQIACTFDSATRRRDRSVRLAFSTNLELTPAELMKLDEQVLSEGYLLWSPNELQLKDITGGPAPPKKARTPSQRLRWEIELLRQAEQSELPEEEYYLARMERLIEGVRNKRKDLTS